ncbi:pyridoxamine 5'-phosphate oxidase family protein [Nocardioides sp.]|uniref:pyridoxamine 5'-phosphate oxidase family protein n=1 Tax=Nocardioides sp. TaxID=35761 RepID=UPI0037C70314
MILPASCRLPAGFLPASCRCSTTAPWPCPTGQVTVAPIPVHNLLERPAVTVLAMSPGDDRVVEVRGRARLTTDPALLATMAVQNQVPKHL